MEKRALPLYAERKRELELCTFCPKLCRPSCPVSNAEPSESLIPWGKMSSAHHLARGDVSDASYAHVAWACTGCHACRDMCHHKNDVAGTLLTVRGEAFSRGLAPAKALAVAAKFTTHDRETARAWSVLRAALPSVGRPVRDRDGAAPRPALWIGCASLRRAPEEAAAIHEVARAVLGGTPRTMARCCGLPLLQAGDLQGFAAHADALASELDGTAEIVVADPGCHVAFEHPVMQSALGKPRIAPLVARAAEHLSRFRAHGTSAEVRYHDACHLGRGLGLYEEPRALLTRALGAAPLEFVHHHARAVCSGAGGGLPWSMPEVSAAMGNARVREHHALGANATIVTACVSSMIRFRKSGSEARGLFTVLAEAL